MPRERSTPIRRVRTGCWTCKQRKVKCDEGRPACRRCEQAARHCGGYGQDDAHLLIGLAQQQQNRQDGQSDPGWSVFDEAHNGSLDPALLQGQVGSKGTLNAINETSDAIWSELMSSIHLFQPDMDDGGVAEESSRTYVGMADVYIAEQAAISAYDEIAKNLTLTEQHALLTALRWSPPAFAFPAEGAEDESKQHLRQHVGHSAWARAMLYLAQGSTGITNLLIAIGSRYGRGKMERQDGAADLAKGKRAYLKGMDDLLRCYREDSSQDFVRQCTMLASTVLVLVHDELDRGMMDGQSLLLWRRAKMMLQGMREMWCEHSESVTGNLWEDCLCQTTDGRALGHFRTLVRVYVWKDTLLDVFGEPQTAAQNQSGSALRKIIARWDADSLGRNTLSSMAIWNAELLDIVAVATYEARSEPRRAEGALEDLIDRLNSRIRTSRCSFLEGESNSSQRKRQILFDILRLTTQLYVHQCLSPAMHDEQVLQDEMRRIVLGMRYYLISSSSTDVHQRDGDDENDDENDAFESVQDYLHLHLAFPFFLACLHITSSEQRVKLLDSLTSVSSQSSCRSVTDRDKDSLVLFRSLVRTFWQLDDPKGTALRIRLRNAVQRIGFVNEIQIVLT